MRPYRTPRHGLCGTDGLTCVPRSGDGRYLAVGADQSKREPEGPGFVRVFEWSVEEDSWVQRGADLVGAYDGAHFGAPRSQRF